MVFFTLPLGCHLGFFVHLPTSEHKVLGDGVWQAEAKHPGYLVTLSPNNKEKRAEPGATATNLISQEVEAGDLCEFKASQGYIGTLS